MEIDHKEPTHAENICECYCPDIDLKEIVIAMLMNDTVKLENYRTYVADCRAQESQALVDIKDLTKEDDIIAVVGKLKPPLSPIASIDTMEVSSV